MLSEVESTKYIWWVDYVLLATAKLSNKWSYAASAYILVDSNISSIKRIGRVIMITIYDHLYDQIHP